MQGRAHAEARPPLFVDLTRFGLRTGSGSDHKYLCLIFRYLEPDRYQRYVRKMQSIKIIIAALALVSILPLCKLAAASAATGDIDAVAYIQDKQIAAQAADVTGPGFTAPLKKKRTAILQQVQCSADAPMLSGTNQVLFFPRNGQSVYANRNFIQRCAQAPPTSPPRSV